jgi:TorA maturation chaperone TorD
VLFSLPYISAYLQQLFVMMGESIMRMLSATL